MPVDVVVIVNDVSYGETVSYPQHVRNFGDKLQRCNYYFCYLFWKKYLN